MASAARDVLTEHVQRQLVIVDEGPAISLDVDVEFVIGEHPRPGLGSLMAGERLVEFLEGSKNAECTIFLISGGASSLCALPQSPVDLDDLASCSRQCSSRCGHHDTQPTACGEFADRRGAILRRVRTSRSIALIMVDNVVSGERWVASGLTFDYTPQRHDVESLLHTIGRDTGRLAQNILEAYERRGEAMAVPIATNHQNRSSSSRLEFSSPRSTRPPDAAIACSTSVVRCT